MDAFRRRDTFASLYPVHNFYWGEWHLDHTVGPEFVDNISPTGRRSQQIAMPSELKC